MEFKVGDKVHVVRKVESEEGWRNSWWNGASGCDGMLRYINDGKEYTICAIRDAGVYFADNGEFGWPKGALELVAPEVEWTYPLRVLSSAEAKIRGYV